MPDYTSILRRSISALPDSGPPMREAVYQRARAALARQLTAVDPPLSTREIERQHQDLEDAVVRLEADYALPDADRAETAPSERDEFASYSPPAPSAPPPPRAEPAARAPSGYRDAPSGRDYDGDDEEEEDDFEDEERGSRVPLLIGLLLLVLVIGGAAAFGYAERGSIAGLLGLSGDAAPAPSAGNAEPAVLPEPAQTAEQPAPDTQQPAASSKRADRLANGTDAPPPQEPLPDAQPPAVLPTDGEAPAEPLPSESPAGQQTAALDRPEQTPGGSIVAQRAIYYFQGAEGQPGKATEGTVAWAETTRENSPAIQATLKLTGQDVTTTVTIFRNNDGTLPASHLVEVQFSGEIGPTAVQRVPALVMKQTEQARGQPLTGAAVPVTNDLFWIALSNEKDQETRNLKLLREGSWFDVPILFSDGTRALLTFEKGIPGDKVFETVMASWTPP